MAALWRSSHAQLGPLNITYTCTYTCTYTYAYTYAYTYTCTYNCISNPPTLMSACMCALTRVIPTLCCQMIDI
jgi:hypothetical protein